MNPSDQTPICTANPFRRVPRRDDETGAALILALAMVVVTGVMMVSLLGWASNDINNVATFKGAQAEQSTLNSAAEAAIAQIRYNFEPQTVSVSPPAPCWLPAVGDAGYPAAQVSATIDLKSYAVNAWCSTQWKPLSSSTRTVTISLCRSATIAATCAGSPELRVTVTFNDYSAPVAPLNGARCTTTCGTGMVVSGWVFDGTAPSVASFSPTSGAVGTTVTITGIGFTAGSTVQFVSTNLAGNVVLPATNVVVGSTTSLTAQVPGVATGSTYYVVVTTPSGTSAFGANFTG